MLWIRLLYHSVHSSQFYMTAQRLNAMNGMQIKTGEKERLSLKGRELVEERRGGRMERNLLGGGLEGAVKCLWSRRWETMHRKSDVGGRVMETKGWMQPHRHCGVGKSHLLRWDDGVRGSAGHTRVSHIPPSLCADPGCSSLRPQKVKTPCRKAECWA